MSMPPRPARYLRPCGFLAGAAAEVACRSGRALPLAGGPLAFAEIELLRRDAAPQRGPVAALDRLLPDAEAQALWREHLTAPRQPIGGLSLDRPRLMGIVNVTPDSFSDGGAFATADAALAHARALADAGADLLDIGGESTRPGAEPVPLAEERRRVLPVLDGLRGLGVPLALDSRKAALMEEAARLGVALVNDVSALTFERDSLMVAAASGLPVVLMHAQGDPRHMQDDPRYEDVLLDVFDWLAARVAACEAAGIPRARLVVDPGIGFGKTVAHNLRLLGRLSLFHGLGCALLVGASRKRFLSALDRPAPPTERLGGSVAAALAAAAQGAQILRVHDVAATRQALAVWRALEEAG